MSSVNLSVAQSLDIKGIIKEDTLSFEFLLKNSSNEDLDVSLMSKMELVIFSGSATILEYDSADDDTTLVDGSFSGTKGPSALAALKTGMYRWKLRVTYLSGEVRTWLTGKCNISDKSFEEDSTSATVTVQETGETVTVTVSQLGTSVSFASQAEFDAGTESAKAVAPDTVGKYIEKSLGAITVTAIPFSQAGYFNQHTQAGDEVWAITGSIRDNVLIRIPYVSNGSNTISFGTGFNTLSGLFGITNGGTLAAGLWQILLWSSGGEVYVNVPAVAPTDISPTTLSSAVVATENPDMMTLTFADAVNITTDGWSLSSDIGGAISFTAVEGGDGTTTPDMTLSRKVVEGEILTISYDASTGNTTKVSNSVEVEDITDDSVTNSVDNPDITAASVEDAEPSDFVFTAERAITGTTAGWTPKINGTPATKTGFSGSGTTTITITVSETVENGDTLTLDYSGGDMVDTYGNVMQTITGQSVTNNVEVGTIIVMQDDFAGAVIDTDKWTVTDPADLIDVSQDGKLYFTGTGNAGGTPINHGVNRVDSDFAFSGGVDTQCLQVDVDGDSYEAIQSYIKIWSGVNDNKIEVLTTSTDRTKIRLVIRLNNSTVYDEDTTVNMTNTIKIEHVGTAIKFFYLSDPDTWTQIGTTQNVDFTGKTMYPSLTCLGWGGNLAGVNLSYDNFYQTNDVYSNSIPV